MEAKLRFFGEIEVDAEAIADVEEAQDESARRLQEKSAADWWENDGIWLGEHSSEDTSSLESSVNSVSNIGCWDGNGDPAKEESDCGELEWVEHWEEEDNLCRSVEVKDCVDLETSGMNQAGARVGEGWEAPFWTGHESWVLSAGGCDGEPFSIVRSIKAM